MLNIKTLPANVLEALRKRGLDDADIAELTPQQAFDEFCRWHGLRGWGNELWSVMDKLQSEVTPAMIEAADAAMIEAAKGVEDLDKCGTPDTWATVYRAMRSAA